ncbi:diguanylate cyclase [Vibrio lamellibrachiae]|uniref:TackOD1 domain-containing metal-binding protein n=1 Tax=Vibrio lamellibrachiae TaxID=2910253 RepID=UPI003D0E56B7
MNKSIDVYCIGNMEFNTSQQVTFQSVENLVDLPKVLGGTLIINLVPSKQDTTLQDFHRLLSFWSWRVYVLNPSPLSAILSDGIFDPERMIEDSSNHSLKLQTIRSTSDIEPLIGWLGLDFSRRLLPSKIVTSQTVYSYPLVELYYPELSSTYRFVLSEVKRDILEIDSLVDRIRVCRDCNSAHLNYIESCPSCKNIDISERVSLHCFTCGHVAEQSKFKRNNKIECPKCLTQLRHIGVDYDRPLETHSCNACAHTFAEAETLSVCFSCGSQNDISELVVRKIYALKLGTQGEYIMRHGAQSAAPELSLQGKVDGNYFSNLLDWVNRLAVRHQEEHLLLGLYLPRLTDYALKNGEAKMFALLEQITYRLNGLFRDSDICCQYKSDVLFVLMPKTKMKNMQVLKDKIEQLCSLIEDEEFTLNVTAWSIPDIDMKGDVSFWLENRVGEIYAAE